MYIKGYTNRIYELKNNLLTRNPLKGNIMVQEHVQ